MNNLSAKYGFNSRVKLEQISENHIVIIKRIKSRIIQKDALKIIAQANAIQKNDANVKVSLVCNNNICSKSVKLLNENGIDIEFND